MVSGFLTSPLDQERMASGDATAMATYSHLIDLVQTEQLAGAFFGANHIFQIIRLVELTN